MKKKALIFGITGQDGSYLAKFLIKKKYEVHGVIRRSSSFNTSRIEDIYQDPNIKKRDLLLHYGDSIDTASVNTLITNILPDEIYNLSAQSHVAVSFEIPEYTSNVDALGALRILDTIRNIKKRRIKYYQAGSSEMFGGSQKKNQNEKTNFDPKSPYAAAKIFAHQITKIYREAYNIYACNGILFNHESPVRGGTFVTKKIVNGLTLIKLKKKNKIYLGNLYSKRDWGHAKDYVKAMWLMMQQKKADDFVIATNKQYSIKEFINLTAKKLGLKISWIGKGIKEKAIDENGKEIIKISKKYIRPLEVDSLIGDYSKAKKILKWKPKLSIHDLIDDMISHELKLNE